MTEPLKPLLDVVVVSSQMHVYISQTDRGEFLIGAEIEPWTTYRQQGTLNFLQESSRHTLELFPQLERARVLRSWAGLCDISPDFSPILGETEVEGFLLSAGWGTYGFKAAPIVGATLAELIATDTTPDADRTVRARAFLPRPPRLRARRRRGLALNRPKRENQTMKNSLEIAQDAELRPIEEIGTELGLEPEEIEPYGRYKGKVSLDCPGPARRQSGRQADLRHGDDPDEGRRGQDDDVGRAHRGHGLHRPQPGPLPARAVAGTGVRAEGRRRRGRLRPGGPDGGPQPALHRRHPRDRRRQQPARGDPRRLDPARQPAPHRRPAGDLEARRGHERPRPATGRARPRRLRQRLSPGDRLRHHRRLRGDGDPRRRPRPPGPAPATGRGSPPPTPARASR